MFKRLKAYFVENMDVIAAGLASLNGVDYRYYNV